MNEHSYIRSLHTLLKKGGMDVDIWKVNDNFAGGVPDVAYFGAINTLWVEYKYIKQLPKKNSTIIDLTNSAKYLSLLQQQWLERKHLLNIRTAVIVGSPSGNGIYDGIMWREPVTTGEFIANAVSNHTVINYITQAVTPY